MEDREELKITINTQEGSLAFKNLEIMIIKGIILIKNLFIRLLFWHFKPNAEVNL